MQKFNDFIGNDKNWHIVRNVLITLLLAELVFISGVYLFDNKHANAQNVSVRSHEVKKQEKQVSISDKLKKNGMTFVKKMKSDDTTVWSKDGHSFAYGGNYWDKHSLSVSIVKWPKKISHDNERDTRGLLDAAIEDVNNANANIKVHYSKDDDLSADIQITYISQSKKNEMGKDVIGLTKNYTNGDYMSSADITLYAYTPNQSLNATAETTQHELGHAMGLNHSDCAQKESTLMSARADSDTDPKYFDYALQNLYGYKAPQAPDPKNSIYYYAADKTEYGVYNDADSVVSPLIYNTSTTQSIGQ